jgi:hypothetical protein
VACDTRGWRPGVRNARTRLVVSALNVRPCRSRPRCVCAQQHRQGSDGGRRSHHLLGEASAGGCDWKRGPGDHGRDHACTPQGTCVRGLARRWDRRAVATQVVVARASPHERHEEHRDAQARREGAAPVAVRRASHAGGRSSRQRTDARSNARSCHPAAGPATNGPRSPEVRVRTAARAAARSSDRARRRRFGPAKRDRGSIWR